MCTKKKQRVHFLTRYRSTVTETKKTKKIGIISNLIISQSPSLKQHRSALMMDMVDVMDMTVRILKSEKKLDQFDKRGQRSCDDDPFRPWEFDRNVLRFLKRVRRLHLNRHPLNVMFFKQVAGR